MRDIKEYNSIKIKQEEKDAFIAYRERNHMFLSSLLSTNLNIEEEIIKEDGNIQLNKSNLEDGIETLKKLFALFIKYSKTNKVRDIDTLYYSTEASEIEMVEKNIFTTENRDRAETYYMCGVEEKAVISITLDPNTTYIRTRDIKNVIPQEEEEILVGPFLEIYNVKEISKIKDITYYSAHIKNKDVIESNGTIKDILSKVNEMYIHLNTYIESISEYKNMNLKRDMATARMSDRSLDKEGKKEISLDIDKIDKTMRDIQEKGRRSKDKYIGWKCDLVAYLLNIYEEEKEYIESELAKEKGELEESKINEQENTKSSMLKDSKREAISLAEENIEVCSSIKERLNKLKQKQETFKAFATNTDLEYIEYTNVDNCIVPINKLLDRLTKIKASVRIIPDEYLEESEYINNSKNLKKLTQLSEDLNSKITKILEVNSKNLESAEIATLKKLIFVEIERIKQEISIAKIEKERNRIINRSGFLRLIDQLTGRTELNRVILEQLDVREDHINEKNMSIREELRTDYSIHHMIAQIDLFVEENEKNKDKFDLSKIKKLRNQIGEIFMLEEDKIEVAKKGIIGSSLPMVIADKKNISKEERVIAEAIAWLTRYGYLNRDNEKQNLAEDVPTEFLQKETERIVAELELKIRIK